MLLITRKITDEFKSKLFKGKVVIIYGPRQSGKTTFIKNLCKDYKNAKYINCDDPENAEYLHPRGAAQLKNFFGNTNLVILDEAQKVKDIGLTLKIIVDTYKDIQIIATGSSAFDLEDKLAEPLTGRHYDFMMFPFSFEELENSGLSSDIEQRIIYGSYPEVVFPKEGDTPLERILSISNDYMLKDILAFEGIRKSDILRKLLKVLAYQMSGEISFREISENFGMSVQTIQNYVEILEKAFIIFMLPPYGGNPRIALRRTKKIYFYDTGLRNAIINNFDSLSVRPDKGALFENYIVSEFYKKNINNKEFKNLFFYRSYNGEEIDIITQKGGKLFGYECKYKNDSDLIKKSINAPIQKVEVITKLNFKKFLLPKSNG
ncbi:MAG: hypothetical protein UU24_C0013G0010 [Candidatus Nomurabacteria bacterium GW2011_GWA2_40_9]|uniref:AAA+ ATPase domain-containing protein n=1 Tax=Candidatus Nomurabacteria bacterium GW2011_GWA2_40_9 TaxID=1618734 RepID=A0A0G0TQL0_9BACT|nr:MAG: hypothetical protein UU24_C0013G0010 [Candidatus Nomurabacteria bacterium GW2011_GWA2_40_9]